MRLVAAATRELVWSIAIERAVEFPYISTYLAFRELPLLWELVDAAHAAGRAANVYLVDGSGILHHRRGGIATCFGVSTDLPTIGVTKKLLCGRPDRTDLPPGDWSYVRDPAGSLDRTEPEEPVEPIGAALRSSPRSGKLIYISPGHRIDVDASVRVVQYLLAGRKLPEPIYWADRLSREEAQSRKAANTIRRQ